MQLIKAGFQGTHDKNFSVARPHGYPHFLFLLIKTPALFTIQGKTIEVQSDSMILYEPNIPHYYCAHQGIYVNDWLHFSLDPAEIELYFKDSALLQNTVIRLSDISFISTLVRLLSDEFYSLHADRVPIMNSLLHCLLLKLIEQQKEAGSPAISAPHYSSLLALRKEIYSNPHAPWSIPLLAKKLNLCPTYLQKLYRMNFHISCMADVILARISYAKDLLTKTLLSVHEVAIACGYNTEVHFMRQFKKNVGMTPSQYRFKLTK